MLAAFRGEKEKSKRYYQDNLTAAESIGDRWSEALAHVNLGERARDEEKYDIAVVHYDQAVNIFTELGLQGGIAVIWMRYALLYLKLENYESAWEYCCMAIEITLELHVVGVLTFSILFAAYLSEMIGDYKKSAELLGLVLTQTSALRVIKGDPTLLNPELLMDKLRKVMREDELQAAINRGERMDLKQVAKDILVDQETPTGLRDNL